MRQRDRQIVPLREVAHHRRRILHAVVPFHARHALRRVDGVAENDVDRHAVAVGVVDRHGGVLQPDRAMREHQQRLAFDLGVAVSHGDRRFFVAAGDEFGTLIAAVVDDRFLQPAETRSRIGADVFETQRLDDIDHEVGAGSIRSQDFDVRRNFSFGFWQRHQWTVPP